MMIMKNHVRSISLPSRSHPSTSAIDESLDKLFITMNTTTVTSSDSVNSGLAGLENLYERTEEFLKMGSTQRVLSCKGDQLMEQMLDCSLRLMDICNVSRDLMAETHEQVLGLQSCVRRRKDVSAASGYVGFRKNMRKEVKKLLGSLKNINIELVMRDHHQDGDDVHFFAVIHAMRRVFSMTVSVLKSFLEFLSGRQNGNDLRSKLALVLMMNKKFHGYDKTIKNEFDDVDSAVSCSHVDLHKKLEKLEVWIGRFEKNLEGLFRELIRTRALLLNIISQ